MSATLQQPECEYAINLKVLREQVATKKIPLELVFRTELERNFLVAAWAVSCKTLRLSRNSFCLRLVAANESDLVVTNGNKRFGHISVNFSYATTGEDLPDR